MTRHSVFGFEQSFCRAASAPQPIALPLFCSILVDSLDSRISLSYLLLIWDHAAQITKERMAGKNSADSCQYSLESNRY